MTTLTWLHLSDLHLRASGVETYNASVVLNKLLEDVSSHVARGLRPDVVFCTGDIAFSGREDEYRLAASFFDRVLEAIGHPDEKRRLFLVPGNHDVSWELITLADESRAKSLGSRDAVTNVLLSQESRQLFLRRLDNYAAFINSYFSRELVTFDDDHYFYVRSFEVGEGIEKPQVAVLGLNSAWVARGGEEDKVIVGESQAQEALSNPLTTHANIRVALLHHPFEQLRNSDCEDTRRSLEQKCDFILVGHRHEQKVRQVQEPDRDLIYIPAGATYEGRDKTETNAYNLVCLDLAAGRSTIHLREYSHGAGRWVEDTRTYGTSRFTFSLSKRLMPITPIQPEHPFQIPAPTSWLPPYLADGVALVLGSSGAKFVPRRAEQKYNRDAELELFQRILRGKDPRRVVVVHSHGERGWGKSSLLEMFSQECERYEPSFTLYLLFAAQEMLSWKHILACTADFLGGVHFRGFSALLHSLPYSKTGTQAGWRAGVRYGAEGESGLGYEIWKERVAEVSVEQVPTYVPSEELQEQLTELFLEELAALPEPAQVVWLVDTVETVGPETQTWLSDMLGRIAKQEIGKIILVVAGRSPLPYEVAWKGGICEMDLKGLPRDAIRQLAQSRGMQGDERTLGILARLLEARTLGNPLEIRALLDGERLPTWPEKG